MFVGSTYFDELYSNLSNLNRYEEFVMLVGKQNSNKKYLALVGIDSQRIYIKKNKTREKSCSSLFDWVGGLFTEQKVKTKLI
jgi:hypothetical protein